MNKREAQGILLALDGLVAQIETLREVIYRSIDETASESRSATATKILTADDLENCQHPDMKIIDTMAGSKSYCFDCGYSQ